MLIVTVTGVEVQGAWATTCRHGQTQLLVREPELAAYTFAIVAAAGVDRAQDYYNQTAPCQVRVTVRWQ
jgi:hypothetical protein